MRQHKATSQSPINTGKVANFDVAFLGPALSGVCLVFLARARVRDDKNTTKQIEKYIK